MNREQIGNNTPPIYKEETKKFLPPNLITKDMCDFLRDLARILENPVKGNPVLATALTKIAKTLSRYSSQDVDELLSGLKFRANRQETKKHSTASILQDMDLTSLDLKIVEKMLRNPLLPKGDIVRLGSERFGISKSKLKHQNRKEAKDAIDGIEAALRNTEALDIIYQEVIREGSRRTS